MSEGQAHSATTKANILEYNIFSATVKLIKAKSENRYLCYHGLLMEELDGLGDMGLL
jgi:hypothetical protein